MSLYRIAGITLRVETEFDSIWMDRFRPFETKEIGEIDGVIRSFVSKEFLLSEDEAKTVLPGKRMYQTDSMQITLHVDETSHAFQYSVSTNADESERSIQFHPDWPEKSSLFEFLLMGSLLEEFALDHGIVTVQASAVETKGQAVVFIGPAGIGKSAQARRWTETIPRCGWISDEVVFLEPTETGVFVHTTPWSGEPTITKSKKLPLKAIVSLDQASHNAIGSTQTLERIRYLFRSVRKFNEAKRSTVQMALIDKIAGLQEMVRYACTDSDSAVETLHRYVFGRDNA